MRARILTLLVPLTLGVGCADSWADIGGTVAGADFQHPRTAWFGGDYIVLADVELPCTQMGWVVRRYDEGIAPREGLAFTAVQLWARDGWVSGGVYDLGAGSGSAPAVVDGLVTDGDGLIVEHARAGTLTIDYANEARIDATLSVAFADDGVGGVFRAAFCQALSLQP